MQQKKEKRKQVSHTGELLYGIHPLIECLKAGKRKILSLYTTKPTPKNFKRLLPHLGKGIAKQYVTRDILTRMAGTPDHMGVVAWVTPYKYAAKVFTPEQCPRVLALDGVQDVRNLGAILRSAYCTGIDAVILGSKNSAPLTAAVFKASAGLAEHLRIYRVPSLPQALIEMKKAGYNLYMTVADGGKPAEQVTFTNPQCLIIGSETTGITPQVKKLGLPVTLSQVDTSSYNASVAAGIFLYLISYSKN